ncbi:MAG: glutamine synthetase beta-grasp domain-containing protein [Oscillospiraceae bacterium]|nr:glutamine synthetase beta-grasp domain-containing protein [Oscillospiraceae bacterium]
MANTIDEVLRFVKDRDNDVKFVRLAFSDVSGTPKNISVQPGELPRAFSEGVAFDGRMFGEAAPPLLFPDPSTLAVLPWRPQHGRVVRFYCDIKTGSGEPAPYDARASLRRAVLDAQSAGVEITVGAACDFYLFRTTEEGSPTKIPFDSGGYLDVYPLDRGENIRRDICSYLEVMSVTVTSSNHAYGPGQNAIAIKESGALECADNIQTFKTVAGVVAAQNGLTASLERNPLPGTSESMLFISAAMTEKGQENGKENGKEKGKQRRESVFGFAPSVNPYVELERIIAEGLKER